MGKEYSRDSFSLPAIARCYPGTHNRRTGCGQGLSAWDGRWAAEGRSAESSGPRRVSAWARFPGGSVPWTPGAVLVGTRPPPAVREAGAGADFTAAEIDNEPVCLIPTA